MLATNQNSLVNINPQGHPRENSTEKERLFLHRKMRKIVNEYLMT